jgi:primosomal protein N' (replication factor Y)
MADSNKTLVSLRLPNGLLEQLQRKKRFSSEAFDRLKDKYSQVMQSLFDKGLIVPVWTGEYSGKSDTLLGYKLNEEKNNNLSSDLKEIFKNNNLLSRKDIPAAGISPYRFRKYLDMGAILPVYGFPDFFDYFKPRPDVDKIIPNAEQQKAIKAVGAGLSAFNPYLLYGITGSGKTLVYCHIARKVLENGGSVLVLVPEIALAGTLLTYFKTFFPDCVALLHSGLSPRERLLIWQNIRSDKYRIVIGARSALFAPLNNPGLIIVDEEHDESYKQDEPAPRFQGRDAAVMRAKMANIPIILGSATPSVESFYNALTGRYNMLKLTRRPEKAEVPVVRVVDLKKEYIIGEEGPYFTKTIISKINKSIKRSHQVILYLNRRGFSPRIKCNDCGYTPECPDCAIALTYHKRGARLMCHFCGYTDASYHICAACKSEKFFYPGAGTQRIEETLAKKIEKANIVRLDSDSATGRGKAHAILSDFAAGKYNVLLGTQMVTKGIDFPDVSLVGVMSADIGLDMPDFRASEKLFAKLIQVAGRSGRGIIPGEVIIQTYNPEMDLIDDAARQDYDTFYQREILMRKRLNYPPFSHLINFRLSSKSEENTEKAARIFKDNLERELKTRSIKTKILGPAICPIYRLRGKYRRQLLVKTSSILKFIEFLDNWEIRKPGFGLKSSILLTIDIDPYDMM